MLINDMPFFDPEGEILDFTANNHTGDFTYLVKTGNQTGVIKYANAVNPQRSVTLAYLEYSHGDYAVKTVTGKNLSGQIIIPTSKGFSLSRNGSFSISMDQESKKINITSLETEEKATLFERSLGDYIVSQDSSGTLSVQAKLAFSLKEVPDAVDFWKKNKDLIAAQR